VLARNRQRHGPARLTDDDIRGNYAASLDWRDGNGVTVLRFVDEPPEVLARVLIEHALPATGG
jgi:hypothetical protein